jgi:S1-C subfamily serine protease
VVNTNLAYDGGNGAGTGMVLTSSGRILTNNHVIKGASTIKIVVPATGRSYRATVVGYDVNDDIAVLQARGAPALKTVSLGSSSSVSTGSTVSALGNANGGGTLVSATGTVTGLNRTITVSDDQAGTETLNGLIETDVELQPGDSGGPLYNNAHKVVGMNAAASTGGGFRTMAAVDSYAIPINRIKPIVSQINSGKSSAVVHIGQTAFLGVAVRTYGTVDPYGDGSGGLRAVVVQVVPGSPAAAAGLAPGDEIVSVGGRRVSSTSDMAALMFTRKPGGKIAISYLDSSGMQHTATVTLASGPPQ